MHSRKQQASDSFATLEARLTSQPVSFPQYDLHKIIVSIFSQEFAYHQITFIDDVIRPFLAAHQSLIVNGCDRMLQIELMKAVSHQDYASSLPTADVQTGDTESVYVDMLCKIPAIACKHGADTLFAVEKIACQREAFAISLIETDGHHLTNFSDFSRIVNFLTSLSKQDHCYCQAMTSLGKAPNAHYLLTSKFARLFMTALQNERELDTIINLLPNSERQHYADAVFACWEGKQSPQGKATAYASNNLFAVLPNHLLDDAEEMVRRLSFN